MNLIDMNKIEQNANNLNLQRDMYVRTVRTQFERSISAYSINPVTATQRNLFLLQKLSYYENHIRSVYE